MKLGRHGAKLRILDALASNGGIRHDAARELGIRRQAFARMIGQLDMWPAVDALDAQLGRGSGMKHLRANRRRDTEEKKSSRLGALAIALPGRAAVAIMEAVGKAEGDLKRAAKLLSTTPATLDRHVSRLGMRSTLNLLAKSHGWLESRKTRTTRRNVAGNRRPKRI